MNLETDSRNASQRSRVWVLWVTTSKEQPAVVRRVIVSGEGVGAEARRRKRPFAPFGVLLHAAARGSSSGRIRLLQTSCSTQLTNGFRVHYVHNAATGAAVGALDGFEPYGCVAKMVHSHGRFDKPHAYIPANSFSGVCQCPGSGVAATHVAGQAREERFHAVPVGGVPAREGRA